MCQPISDIANPYSRCQDTTDMVLHPVRMISAILLGPIILLAGCVKLTPLEEQALYHKENAWTREVHAQWFANDTHPYPWLRNGMHGLPPRVWLLSEAGDIEQELMIRDQPVHHSHRHSIHPRFFEGIPEDREEIRLLYSQYNGVEHSTMELRWVSVPQEVEFRRTRRSWPLLITYPIWGLPRDLIDVPWTGLRRMGFADDTGLVDSDPATAIIVMSGIVIGTAAAATLVFIHVAPLAVAIPLAVIAAVPGAYVGFTLGVWTSFVAGPIGRGLSDTIQVPLLRGGIDSENYFPNWKFVAHRPEVVTDSGSVHWYMVDIKILARNRRVVEGEEPPWLMAPKTEEKGD